LHCAVAPVGVAGVEALVRGGLGAVDVDVAVLEGGAGVDAAESPYQVLIPPWLEQAPCCVVAWL
jgi:hypothetical protein